MRIAIATETFLPSIDGVVTRLTKGIEYLRKEGHEVLVLAPDLGVKEYQGAVVKGIPTIKLPFYRFREFSYPTKKVHAALEEFNADIIHVANPLLLGASAVSYAKKNNVPLICSYHTHIPKYLHYYGYSILEPLIWSYVKKMHKDAHINLCTSQSMEKELTDHEIEDVYVLKRGVDLTHRNPLFFSQSLRDRLLEGDPEKKLLLFVGRLAAEKEIHRLRTLFDEREDIRLIIAGDGPEREVLEETFKGTDTRFLGFVQGEDLSSLYASCDAFIFPSLSETLGLVLLEAMASGLPVIAANSEPTIEQIQTGENGLVFDAEKKGSLSETLNKLEDTQLIKKIIQKGLADAGENSWEKASEHLYQYYEAAIHAYQKGFVVEKNFMKRFREVS
ncbi:MAG: glycosyltransferase family 1 protein [Gallicola sp.]|nr:glycosyltransferase family 1 protein [Gallicola sp.]